MAPVSRCLAPERRARPEAAVLLPLPVVPSIVMIIATL